MNQNNNILISPIGDIPDWIPQTIALAMHTLFGFEILISSLMNDLEGYTNPPVF